MKHLLTTLCIQPSTEEHRLITEAADCLNMSPEDFIALAATERASALTEQPKIISEHHHDTDDECPNHLKR